MYVRTYLLFPNALSQRQGVAAMAPRGPVLPLARRGLSIRKASSHLTRRAYSHFPPARRRCLLQQQNPNCLLTSRGAFSTTQWRSIADGNDSFDPRQQDRESDEVDVCIVGGGMYAFTPLPTSKLTFPKDLLGLVQLSDSSK